MPKAIIQLGYNQYVVDAQDALKVYEIINKAERYRSQYRSREDGGTVHYVWPQDDQDDIKDIRIISDSLYQIAKMAGKPED